MFSFDADFPSDLRALEREYELIRELGQGGMAAVYLARRRDNGKLVAIKAIRARYLDDPDALQRFTREAATVAGLDHPNIVRTESVEQIGDRAVAIIMEHVPGGTVRDWLREHGSLGAEHAESILRDVASALGYAHRHGIVHRDVKPENVFLDPEHGRALLSDFGIARRIDGDAGITLLGAALGTPQYMSPEQIDGQFVDGRSDIYSLGVLGWELLTGRRPWAGESLYGVIYKQKHEDLPRITSMRPRVPANLLFAIERALVKDRKLRWQNTDEFLEQLTYNPPPVLAQTYPPGAVRRDDHPTVRFRRLALVRDDDDAPAPDVDASASTVAHAESPAFEVISSDPIAEAGASSPPLPVAQFVATDEPFQLSDEPFEASNTPSTELPVAAEVSSHFVLPTFEPNADEPFEFPQRRARLLRAIGLVASLAIAASALFIVLSGSADDDAPGASGSPTMTSSAGTLASDSLAASPVGGNAGFVAKPASEDGAIVSGSSATAPLVPSETQPAPVTAAPARRPSPPSASTRNGGSITASGPVPSPTATRTDAGNAVTRQPQRAAEATDRSPAVRDDVPPAASTDSALEDPFKIPAPSATAPSSGNPVSTPSPRCLLGATADQLACLDTYIAINDAPLTQAFDALVAELRRRAGTPVGAPDPPTVQRVRVEQRAWLSVRNSECPRTRPPGGGPFWAEAQSQCFAEMAVSRTAELRDAVRRLKRN
jgi:serine/threonine protein kinase/uncharacterized protein YecT (DUF1311 family)